MIHFAPANICKISKHINVAPAGMIIEIEDAKRLFDKVKDDDDTSDYVAYCIHINHAELYVSKQNDIYCISTALRSVAVEFYDNVIIM